MSVKICPMCGSDILAADTGVKCSSCGASLQTPSGPPDSEAMEGNAPQGSETPSRVLDDSQPIMHTDLEVVQSGHAFWAESAKKSDDEATDPGGVPIADAASKTSDECEPEAKKTALFEADRANADAPSLAELARRRKAQLIQEGFAESSSEIRHDHVTRPSAEGASQEHDATNDRENRASVEEPVATRRTVNLDDTQPAGVKTEPAALVSLPVPGVVSVAKSPDIALIDDNKLSIPGVRWSSGEKVVISGRTFELRRKIAKYPVSPREMVIGTGAFLGGIVLAWMIAAGGGEPSSALFGAVRAGDSGKLLAGVTIALEETNQTVQSDPSGMFYVTHIPDGIYTLVATDPIYGSSKQSLTVAGDATTIMMDLERPELAEIRPEPPPVKKAEHPKAPSESNGEEASGSVRTGALAVESSVANARVFIDGKLLGVGSAVYSDIKPGKHEVEIRHDGFEPWQKTMTFTAGKVTRLAPELTPKKQAEPVRLSAEEYAVEGRKSIEARKYKVALEQFDLAIKIEQKPQFLAWRAEAFVGLKDLAHAEADFIKAIDLFRKSNQSSRLEGLVERAVLVVPQSPALWLTRGEYLYTQRKLRDAEKSYRRALELGAKPAAAHTGIGLTQYAGGSFQSAFESWTLADEASGETDPHLAGYLALASARLQYRASCRDAVRRLATHQDVLTQFRAHPDWDKVQRLTGQG